ncbi:paraquat-inducible protein A [Pararhodobacter marinus]|uniref:paraquat-inducible protein A n=1 Tax=Pararhodobacter marinus TaxID=2184063 RepID=UPI0035146B8B
MTEKQKEAARQDDTGALSDLIVCPSCDALYKVAEVPTGGRARCGRCGHSLMAPRENAMARIVMLAATSLVLMTAALFFPFIEITAGGITRRTSVLDAALTFSQSLSLPLALAVAAFIIVLPVLRLLAIVYALAPMSLGWYAPRHARTALRLAEEAKPWAMAEIFILGVAVALVKIAGLAHVGLGAAFWALALLVLVNILNDNFMCRLTLWRTLEQRSRS